MVGTSDDLKQYFPAVLDGAAKHLKEFSWDIFHNNTFLNK
jgi:hypothetical protein